MHSAPARTRPYVAAGTALAVTAAVLLAADAASLFSRLLPAAVAAMSVAAVAGLIALAARRPARGAATDRLRLALALSLIAVLALSGNRLIRGVRMAALPAGAEKQAMQELDHRASVIQQEFASLLARSARPIESGRSEMASFDGSAGGAFDLLDRVEEATGFTRRGGGLAMYDAGRHPLAWTGVSYPATAGLLDGLPEGTLTYRISVEQHMARLYALMPAGGFTLVTEITVMSRLDSRLRDRAFPSLAGDDTVELKLQDFRKPETGFANLLARKDDRYTGGAPGGRPLLFVGLRDPKRIFLGYARLQGIGRSDMSRRVDAQHRDAAGFLVASFVAALCLVRFYPLRTGAASGRTEQEGLAPAARAALDLAVLWGGRVILSWFPVELASPDLDLFDSSQFASAGFFHLLRSPGDLLLTALAILASALVLVRACGRAGRAGPQRGTAVRLTAPAGWLMLVVMVGGALRYVPVLGQEFVGNSAVNLLSVDPLSAPPATLALQASALLILLSLFLAVEAALHLIGSGGGPPARIARLLPRPGDGMSRWAIGAFLPGVLLAAVLYDPLLAPPSRTANEKLFEGQLMPMVIRQSENRRAMVSATIDALEGMPDLPDKIMEAGPASSSLALDLWLHTPLKDSGYNASLLVMDPDGRTISRFARNLPPAFDRRAPETYSPPGEPTLEQVSFLNLTKRIWHADHYVISGDRLLGTVTIHMLDDFDNIPFLIAERPYARALSPQLRRVTTLSPASHGVLHAVYDRHGRPVFWNQREAPLLPAGWTSLLVSPGTMRWCDLMEDERPARYLFFSDGDHLFALGFTYAAVLERIARGIRLTFLGIAVLAALLVPAALLHAGGHARVWWSQILEALGRTHYRKLLATFTAATLIPLFLLSVLMSGYITRELKEDIEDRGRQGIESASSLVRTILETEDKVRPDDDTLYWLSLLVGEDVNLYEHGEMVATSRPELFSSGLLSERIDGAIYRRLVLEGGRFAMGEETLKGDAYRTITATVVANEGNWEGLLSLPLDAETADAVMAAREVSDAMIITFTGMVVLMGGVAYLLARRVSRPIRSLSAAAARIAGGDLDAVVVDRPRDETGELIASFNRMALAIKEQRADLERRRDYIEKVLLNATIGVISMDRDGRVVTANPAARAILDLPHLAAGAVLPELVSTNVSLRPLAGRLGDTAGSLRDVELTIPAAPADRTVRARLVTFLEGAGLILLLEDVTETVRSNRLAAWAEMARRIAHEVKNPLTPIQLSAEHIRRVYDEGSPQFPAVLEECLRTIMGAVADLRRISAEFSTYARIPVPRKELSDMSALLAEVVRPYRAAAPPGIRFEIDLPDALPRLSVDRSLVARALVNLIENALQAMPRGGTLSVRARAEGDQLAIEVSDTGIGMDPASLARIFEPYFSTKDTGTGLGMAIARKAIEEHGGRIDVTSSPGNGTTMRILLPISPAAPPVSTAPVVAGPAAGRRRD